MASGLPCVSTDAGDAAYILNEKKYIVPIKNPEKLAMGMRNLFEMENRQAVGLNGRQRVLQRFSIQAISEAYSQLYLSLMRDL